jgi:hypothetical protein
MMIFEGEWENGASPHFLTQRHQDLTIRAKSPFNASDSGGK